MSFILLPKAVFINCQKLLHLNLYTWQIMFVLFFFFTLMATVQLRIPLPYIWAIVSLPIEPQHTLHTGPTMTFSRVVNLSPQWLPIDFGIKISVKLEFKALQDQSFPTSMQTLWAKLPASAITHCAHITLSCFLVSGYILLSRENSFMSAFQILAIIPISISPWVLPTWAQCFPSLPEWDLSSTVFRLF